MKTKTSLNQSELISIAKSGFENHNCTVCFCQEVDRKTITRAINQGAKDLETVCKLTGAGTHCGSCRVYIKELLGENLWQEVRLTSMYRYSENYCALRFTRPDGTPWRTENPGAYFILQVKISGEWQGRPYAMTDDGATSGLREITIKRKKDGFFTNWIFNHLDELTKVPMRISTCMGGSVFDPDSLEPIICLIGGVGITPVLALCRMLAKNPHHPEICIDYSASTEEDFFCRDELNQIALDCNLEVRFRQTQQQGRIQQTDILALLKRYPDQNFYICGPEAFKASLVTQLHQAHVTPLHIIDLEASQTRSSTNADLIWGYRLVGLILLIAYYLQDQFDFKLPQLEQLQANDNYKIFSGLLLLTYILSQWRLPISRWLKQGLDKIEVKKHSHQYFGAIAPLVFYLHASSIGYAYLAVLASVYLVNSLLGYSSGEFIQTRYKKTYVFSWTVMHVCLSTSLLFLSFYHAYIALAYK